MKVDHWFSNDEFTDPERPFYVACSIHGSHDIKCNILYVSPWERGRKVAVYAKKHLPGDKILSALNPNHFREMINFL